MTNKLFLRHRPNSKKLYWEINLSSIDKSFLTMKWKIKTKERSRMVSLLSSKNIGISIKNHQSNAKPNKINRKHQPSRQRNSLNPTYFPEIVNKSIDKIADTGTSSKNSISLKTTSFPILSNTK